MLMLNWYFLPALKEGDMKRRLPDIIKWSNYDRLQSLEDGIKEILKNTKFIL